MQIHVARNSTQLGVFAPEEIIAGLASGRFLASDLAWRDGMAAWTPLGDWSEFRGVGVPPSPGVSAASAPVVSTIPWEQGKSLSSFFATVKLAIVNPASLSTGRFAFRSRRQPAPHARLAAWQQHTGSAAAGRQAGNPRAQRPAPARRRWL